MKDAISLIREQTIILVDVFAASFLFVFIAFLTLLVSFVSVDQVDSASPNPGGLKSYTGNPFKYREIRQGMNLLSSSWRHFPYVELHESKVVTYVRSQTSPTITNIESPLALSRLADQYMDSLLRDHERLGRPVVEIKQPEADKRPAILLYIYDHSHYYAFRDRIQDADLYWAEYIVPLDANEFDDLHQNAMDRAHANLSADGLSNEMIKQLLDGSGKDELYDDILSQMDNMWSNIPDLADMQWTPLDVVVLTDAELHSTVLPEEDTVSRRNLVLAILAVIGLLFLLEYGSTAMRIITTTLIRDD